MKRFLALLCLAALLLVGCNDGGNKDPEGGTTATTTEVVTTTEEVTTTEKVTTTEEVTTVPVTTLPEVPDEPFDVTTLGEGSFTASNQVVLPYRIYLPEDYSKDETYPVMLYLHSEAVRGNDNASHLSEVGICFASWHSPAFGSIVIAPQCPQGEEWTEGNLVALAELLDEINGEYSADPTRQYILGGGMGGDGVWQMLMNYPEKLTAAVPVASDGVTFELKENGFYIAQGLTEELLQVPIYMLYDSDDQEVTASYSKMVVSSHRTAVSQSGGVKMTFKETSGYGHDIAWSFVSAEDYSVLTWLFEQVKET